MVLIVCLPWFSYGSEHVYVSTRVRPSDCHETGQGIAVGVCIRHRHRYYPHHYICYPVRDLCQEGMCILTERQVLRLQAGDVILRVHLERRSFRLVDRDMLLQLLLTAYTYSIDWKLELLHLLLALAISCLLRL